MTSGTTSASGGAPGPAGVGRRQFLVGSAGLTVGGLLLPSGFGWAPAAAGTPSPYSMAMHVHASFSEGDLQFQPPSSASMAVQLDQARQTGVDVVWWTEHDWRMSAHAYRQSVHFDAMTEAENGAPWSWLATSTGTPTGPVAGIVAAPVSPVDPSPAGSLHLATGSTGTAWSSYGVVADQSHSRYNGRSSLAGLSLGIQVRPARTGPNAYLELLLTTSRQPARSGIPAGTYRLSYRFGGPGTPGQRTRQGLLGIVTVAAARNAWTGVVLSPADDLTAIFGIDGRDASVYDIALLATARGTAVAEGYFDYLQFVRTGTTGDQPLATQQQLMTALGTRTPGVVQHQALEFSLMPEHMNWFGEQVHLPDYSDLGLTPPSDPVRWQALVTSAHAAGGLVSYNHPFGSGFGPALGQAAQDAALRRVATTLLGNRCQGADILEVGYRVRGGVDLSRHAGLWDVLSRNAIFLTGNGVSDDHGGLPWAKQPLNWVTWAWAAGSDVPSLLAALAAGRGYFGDPVLFSGSLDLSLDGTCPMGSVSISTAATRQLTISATAVPADGAVLVVRGAVDYAGTAAPVPNTTVRTIAGSRFTTGSAAVRLDTSTSCFVRAVVVDRAGVELALSNPVWSLRSAPPGGIPAARRV